MRIAQVAPLQESVPPKYYGGTERVVSYLTEELVRQGHDVTLFASGDSQTAARLHSSVPEALRMDGTCRDPLAHYMRMLGQVALHLDEFDIVHFHIDYLHYPLFRTLGAPHVTTLHGRLDLPELDAVYRDFPDMPVVSISNHQRGPLPGAAWQATVYHGLPRGLYTYRSKHDGYLAFMGRISPEKRVDRAIRLAVEAGMALRIAAKVDKVDRDYFEEEIRPLLKLPRIEYIGEIGDQDKNDFLGGAAALLFPIDWPEPFGLVMIEAMACGTPVIAYRRGSVPEVMADGETGFVVDDFFSARAAIEAIDSISRLRCRRVFEERFSVEKMAKEYLAVYEGVMDTRFASRQIMA